jgi:energy-converting hydrogenase Eha subunit A
MPRNVAQLTGMIVTTIIVFGSDLDVFYALPLGVFAGALATLFAAFAEYQAPKREPAPIRISR